MNTCTIVVPSNVNMGLPMNRIKIAALLIALASCVVTDDKIKGVEKQLEMLYEEIGLKLERYFEIADPITEAPQAYQVQGRPDSVSIASSRDIDQTN